MEIHLLCLLSCSVLTYTAHDGDVDPADNYPNCMNNGLAFNITEAIFCFWLSESTYFYSADAANDFCRSSGGELAIIPESSVGDFIVILISNKGFISYYYSFYIGYTIEHYTLKRHVDNVKQSWANWYPGEPSSSTDECLAVGSSSGKLYWYQKPCKTSNVMFALCMSVISQPNAIAKTIPNISTQTAARSYAVASHSTTDETSVTTTIHTEESTKNVVNTSRDHASTSTTSDTTFLSPDDTFNASIDSRTDSMFETTESAVIDTTGYLSLEYSSKSSGTPSTGETSTNTENFLDTTASLVNTTTPNPNQKTAFHTATASTTRKYTFTTLAPTFTTNINSSPVNPCNCSCTYYIGGVNMTQQLREEIDKLKKYLMVDKRTLSSVIRTKTCADDPRPSAIYVGSVGVAMLIFALGGLLLLDGPRIGRALYLLAYQAKLLLQR